MNLPPATVRYAAGADAVLDTLVAAGYQAYYVGGCVRDRVRGLQPHHDIDVATNAPLTDICRILPRAHVVGEAFSVALVDDVEVATFRRDGPYSDYRHPDHVTLVQTIEEDLSRRDFTINAMAQDRAGNLVDPFGGRADLEAHVIRFVGVPVQRLREDPVRALRACRFAAMIGGRVEARTAEAIRADHGLVHHVARERVQQELNKMLMLDDRATALQLLQDFGLLPHVLPRLARSVGVPQEGSHGEDCWEHAVACTQAVEKRSLRLRLAALLHDIGKPATRTRDEDGTDHFYRHNVDGVSLAEEELRELRYSADIIAYVQDGVRHHLTRVMFCREMTDTAIRRLMGKLTHMPIRDLLRLQLADWRANFATPVPVEEELAMLRYVLGRIRHIEAENHALKVTDLAIDGRDVMRVLGEGEGARVGEALRFCLEAVLAEPEKNEREELLRLVRKWSTGVVE
jgi:putative nucleotidyltransferase with HDIG domain